MKENSVDQEDMRTCHICGTANETVAKSRILPAGFGPTLPCGCAMMCYNCRQTQLQVRLAEMGAQ